MGNLVDRAVRYVVGGLVVELRDKTPRDTGYAAANWIPSTGYPVLHDESVEGRDRRAALVSARQAEQEAALQSILSTYTVSMGTAYVSNGAPYIADLNDGSSAKAPAAFVQSAIVRVVERLTALPLDVEVEGF